MLALGHQFVFKALRSLDCCSDAAHTQVHTHRCSLRDRSTQRCVFIIQMIHTLPQWNTAFIVLADQLDGQ